MDHIAVSLAALVLTFVVVESAFDPPFFEFKKIDDALKKFFINTQGATKWPQQFKGGWDTFQMCAWDGNERAHGSPWGTRCVAGGWHPPPPRGDGGLLYIEHYSGTAEGDIPAEFEAFQTTEVIGLGHNKLSGPLWNTSYHQFLHRLDLAHNRITGTLHPEFMSRNVDSMELINLEDNQLTGSLPASLNRFPYLTALLLGTNQLSGTVPDLSNLKQLRQLNLGNNKFEGTIGTWLKEMTNLAWVHLENNQFEGTLPELPPKVSRVYLGGNKWSGKIPNSYGERGYLRVFECTGCKIECPTPDFLNHVYNSTHCKTRKW